MARETHYGVDELARAVGVSRRQLERHYCRSFGVSPKAWLDALRMADARRLLGQGKLVKEVALDLGFKHPQHFSRAFKRMVASSPNEARR